MRWTRSSRPYAEHGVLFFRDQGPQRGTTILLLAKRFCAININRSFAPTLTIRKLPWWAKDATRRTIGGGWHTGPFL